MDKTCKFLKISSIIFKVLAWVSLAFGFISGVIIFIGGGGPDAPRATGFVAILLGMVYFFISFTASGVIALLLDIRTKLDKGPEA
ncbi:hypothetical protein ACFL28_00165 [Candidatus Omnitrophota bacterium]